MNRQELDNLQRLSRHELRSLYNEGLITGQQYKEATFTRNPRSNRRRRARLAQG